MLLGYYMYKVCKFLMNFDIILVITVQPVIQSQPESQEKVAGESVTFRCSATGYPPPSISWTHSGGLQRGNNATNVTAGNATSLPLVESYYTINTLDLIDVGFYHCSTTNTLVEEFSYNSTQARLTLKCE